MATNEMARIQLLHNHSIFEQIFTAAQRVGNDDSGFRHKRITIGPRILKSARYQNNWLFKEHEQMQRYGITFLSWRTRSHIVRNKGLLEPLSAVDTLSGDSSALVDECGPKSRLRTNLDSVLRSHPQQHRFKMRRLIPRGNLLMELQALRF